MLLLFVSVWLTDTGAYLVGSAVGRWKLSPRISPNKTVEGAVGGLLLAVLGAALLKQLQIARVLWEFRPDIVITHWFKDMHPDHVSTALLTHYGVNFAIKEHPEENIWHLDWHKNKDEIK